MTTDYFVSESYIHGTGYENKGLIFGKEAGIIKIHPNGHSIEKFWPSARVFSNKIEGFAAPLSSDDITRLSSMDQKILFYVTGVNMPGAETVGSYRLSNILFAYQILRDKNIHWTLNNISDAQVAIKKSILRSNIGKGVGNAVVTVVTFPISLLWAKRSMEESTIRAKVLPSMEELKSFVQKYAKR